MAFTVPPSELALLRARMGKPNTEVEVRFGRYDARTGRSTAGVGKHAFKRMLGYYAQAFAGEGDGGTEMLKIYAATGQHWELRGADALAAYAASGAVPVGTPCYRKTKAPDGHVDNREYGYRVAVASETDVAADDVHPDGPLTFRRLRRYSFGLPGLRVDLSVTKTSDAASADLASSDLASRPMAYEVELELAPGGEAGDAALLTLYRHVQLVLCYVQDTFLPVSDSESAAAVKAYGASFCGGAPRFLGADVLSLGIGNVLPPDAAPDVLNVRRAAPEDYTVTVKADGERALLYVGPGGVAYLINKRLQAKRTGITAPTLVDTLIDGELCADLNLFLAFDMLFLKGADLRGRPMFRLPIEKGEPQGRIEALEDAIGHKSLWTRATDAALGLRAKAYSTIARRAPGPDDLPGRCHALWQTRASLKYHADGLIFTPRAHPYPDVAAQGARWPRQLKWKPRQLLSIDFQVRVRRAGGQELVKYDTRRGDDGPSTLVRYKVVDLFVGEGRRGNVPFEPDVGADFRAIATWGFSFLMARSGT